MQLKGPLSITDLKVVILFAAAAGIWWSTVGSDMDRIRIDAAATRDLARDTAKLLAQTEKQLAVKTAVDEKQTEWMISALQRLQVDRGIQPYPIPRTP